MKKKATMTDIAKALGVSQTLVSFVLSGRKDMGISNETKIKVLKTAEELGYCSHTASKMLRLGRSGFVALVFAENPGNNIIDIIGGINSVLSEYGYSLIIVGNPKETIDTEECVKLIGEQKADGFIIFGKSEKLEKELSSPPVPFKVLFDASENSACDCARLLCESILLDDESKTPDEKSVKVKSIKRTKPSNPKKAQKLVEAEETSNSHARNNSPVWLL